MNHAELHQVLFDPDQSDPTLSILIGPTRSHSVVNLVHANHIHSCLLLLGATLLPTPTHPYAIPCDPTFS